MLQLACELSWVPVASIDEAKGKGFHKLVLSDAANYDARCGLRFNSRCWWAGAIDGTFLLWLFCACGFQFSCRWFVVLREAEGCG